MKCCSPFVKEEGSQIIVVVVNPLVQHPSPMLLLACQTCYYVPRSILKVPRLLIILTTQEDCQSLFFFNPILTRTRGTQILRHKKYFCNIVTFFFVDFMQQQ
jgi:hypothetical protein